MSFYQGGSTADHKADTNDTSGRMIQREGVVEHCKYIVIDYDDDDGGDDDVVDNW